MEPVDINYESPPHSPFSGLALVTKWLKRSIIAVFFLAILALGAVCLFDSVNSVGVASSPASLPVYGSALSTFQCSSGLSWHFHRSRITGHHAVYFSGRCSPSEIDALAAAHRLNVLEAGVQQSGVPSNLDPLPKYAPALTVDFDKGDTIYLGGDAVLHNVMIFYRLRDGAFTVRIGN